MRSTSIDAMTGAEVRDLVRIHAKMFAYLRHLRNDPRHDEKQADAFAARHWRRFRDMALDYLAVSIALAEKEAGHPCPA